MNKGHGVQVEWLKQLVFIMKRTLFVLTLLALSILAMPRSKAADGSVDLFYNNLSGGNWIEVADYGYGWQPDVAVSDPDWRPYADGYWAYTDYGWTWVSYEDFGWATYHYGRWARLEDMGWVWFPGSDLEWGPAWVSWRTGGDQIGWAPLPPRGPGIVYEGRPIDGHVDVEFDIGPAYYNFIDIRFIGEPVLRSHIYAPSYNVTYINQTVNVTNITLKNKVVYNYGPDYNVLAQHSARPIQRLKIERQTNVDVGVAARSGALTKVQGDRLVVAAPQTLQKPAKAIAPPAVKTKVPETKIERGWKGIGDENTKAQLKQKMQTEDAKKVPPPTAGAAGAPPAVGPTTPAGASPFERGKHGKPGQFQPGMTPQVSPGAAASPAFTPMKPERDRGKGQRSQPPGATTPPKGAETAPLATPRGPAHGKGVPLEVTPPSSESATVPDNAPKGKPKGPPERGYQTPSGYEQGQPQGQAGPPHGKRFQPGMTPAEAGAAGPNPQERGPKHRMESGYSPPPQGAPPATHGGPGKAEGGKTEGGKKQKGEKESPPPG
jgi:hypothetical protein